MAQFFEPIYIPTLARDGREQRGARTVQAAEMSFLWRGGGKGAQTSQNSAVALFTSFEKIGASEGGLSF